MKFYFLHRVLSIILILVFLMTGFILLSNIQEILSELETQPEKPLTFKFVILFSTGFILFLLSLFRPKQEVVIEKIINPDEVLEEDKNEAVTSEQNQETELLSAEELEKEAEELFPKENIENLKLYSDKLLTNISKKFEMAQGLIFFKDQKEELYKVSGKYAYFSDEPPKDFKEGETLPGQVAKNQQLINIDDIPEGYVKVISGLGTSYPRYLLIVPAIHKEKTVGIIEIASFKLLDKNFENLMQVLANKLVEKTIKVTKD